MYGQVARWLHPDAFHRLPPPRLELFLWAVLYQVAGIVDVTAQVRPSMAAGPSELGGH